MKAGSRALNKKFAETGIGVDSQRGKVVFFTQILLGKQVRSGRDRQKLHLKVQTYAGCDPSIFMIL